MHKSYQNFWLAKARVKRRPLHEPNRMQMRENKGFFSFAFDSAHVKYSVWPRPKAPEISDIIDLLSAGLESHGIFKSVYYGKPWKIK